MKLNFQQAISYKGVCNLVEFTLSEISIYFYITAEIFWKGFHFKSDPKNFNLELILIVRCLVASL